MLLWYKVEYSRPSISSKLKRWYHGSPNFKESILEALSILAVASMIILWGWVSSW